MRKSAVPSKPLAWPEKVSESDAAQSGVKKCRHCAEPIAGAATRCTHCGRAPLTEPEPKKDPWEGYDV